MSKVGDKVFDQWNKDKKKLDGKSLEGGLFLNTKEIWFTKMGKNIGFEEDGKKDFSRPVLILKKVGNMFFIVALTTKGKDDNRFYHKFSDAYFYKKEAGDSYAILSQVKVMDKKRFQEKIGYVGEEEFKEVKNKITALVL